MKLRIFFLTVFAVLYAACSFGETMILKKQDTQFFTVKVINSENDTVNLLISGLVFHGGLSVSKVTSEIEGDNLLIKVYLQPAVKGGSGRFECKINVPPTVSNVLFGVDRVSIWKKSETPAN